MITLVSSMLREWKGNDHSSDIGTSVSLMPYSIYKRLNLEELKPTNMCLSMADKSITYPLGILENVPTKVWKFVILADFIVL